MTSNIYDHRSVLRNEILENIKVYKHIKVFCDCTVGEGGHIAFLSEHLENWRFIGIDRDREILNKAAKRLGERVLLFNDSYANIREYYTKKIGVFLLDLGLSMFHIKSADRGFSWQKPNEPLDMRFSLNNEKTAAIILNNYSSNELDKIFEQYGDIGNPEEITKKIVLFRKNSIFKVVNDLFKALNINDPKHYRKFLSKLFQALRIETNGELNELKKFLKKIDNIKNSGSLFFFISYHSGEDRLIKETVKDLKSRNKINIINKHVIKPKYDEIKENKAARSAKMRVIQFL